MGISCINDNAPRLADRRGLTLVEMLIAVTVLAILVSVAVPAIRSTQTATLESTARILAADLRLARSQAIQYGTSWSVQFDLVNNAYDLVHTGTATVPVLNDPLAKAGATPGSYRVELDPAGTFAQDATSIRIASAALKDSATPVTDVTFGALGGTGPTRVEDTVILVVIGTGSDMRSVELTVSWITGQVWIAEPEMYSP
jgi:prepilin-type N-terminal cleavage/methylation domain-containing protein